MCRLPVGRQAARAPRAQADENSLRPSSGRDPSSTDSARMAAAASGRATAFLPARIGRRKGKYLVNQ